MDKILLILMSFLLYIGLASAAVTTVKRDNSQQLPLTRSTSSDLETAESGKLLDLGGLLNRNPYGNYQGYSGYNPYGGGYNNYNSGRFGYGGYSGTYPNTGGFVPSTYYGGTGYYGQQNPGYYGGGYGGYGSGYGTGYGSGYGSGYGGYGSGYGAGYGTTNLLGGQYGGYGNSGYGGYGGHRNLGYGYYSDSDRYGFRNSYVPTSPSLHVSGYRGYD